MAARVVECIEDDLENQDLAATLCRENQIVSCSGLNEGEYLDLKQILQTDKVSEFEPLRHLPFPSELNMQLGKSQSNIAMGLLPDITRAWMSIDNDLFFWNFDTNEDLAYFDSIQDTILKVELVKPKVGLVEPDVHFILVVFTATEICLLAVCFTDNEMKSIPRGASLDYAKFQMVIPSEILFATPNDAQVVHDIVGTENGRIFFTSGDNLYELTYQNKTWFRSARCDKINITKSLISHLLPAITFFTSTEDLVQISVDETRHLLYSLGERGSIQCIDLGADGTKTDKSKILSIDEIRKEIRGSCGVEDEFLAAIKFIKAIPSTKSQYITLEAITSKSLRIYLTVYNDRINYPGGIDQDSVRAQTLRVVHVRYPPTNVYGLHSGNHIYTAFVDTESTLVAQMPDDDSTTLNIYSRSSFQYAESHHMESYADFSFSGSIWSFARLPADPKPPTVPGLIAPVMPPWVVREHLIPTQKIYTLTSNGIYVFLQHSPVQMFRQILKLYDTDSRQFQWFLSVHFSTEVCIMALIVLCSDQPEDVQIHMAAARIIVEFGGEATTTMNEFEVYAPNNMSIANMSGILQAPLKSSTPQGKPQSMTAFGTPIPRNSMINDENMPMEYEHIRPSSRHEAIYIYFSRLVMNLWGRRLCYRDNNLLFNNLPMDEVERTANEIGKLLSTIEQHNLIYFNTTSPYLTAALLKAGEQEHNSLKQFCEMAKNTRELLNLWKIMDEHQFHVLTQLLPDDVFSNLIVLSFSEAVAKSQDVASELVTCIIKHYIGDEATTAMISQRLSDECPSMFTNQDANLLKASEFITIARHLPFGIERFNNIRKAADIIAKSIERVNMDLVCSLLTQVHAYDCIVEIALERAKRDDPTKIAIIAYRKNLDVTEPRVRDAIRKRESSYKYIGEILDMLQQRISGHTTDVTGELSIPMATDLKKTIIDLVFNVEDELAHVYLFQWMLRNGMEEDVLNKRHKFFEEFLYHELHDGGNERYLQLLWRYHQKNENFLGAAKVLLDYAEKSPTITLKTRLDYLGQALMCMNSAEESRSNIELKNQIAEFLAVARVQQAVKDEIEKAKDTKISPANRRKAIDQLDRQLFTLTDLFTKFANELHLPKLKLMILQCANHYEQDAVQDIWQEILQQDLLGFERKENPEQIRRTVAETLSKMYRLYFTTQDYIPLGFILRELLIKGFEKATPDWLPNICKDSNIPLAALLRVIIGEFTNDPFWKTNQKSFEFMIDLGKFVFDDFLKNYAAMSSNDRSVMKEQCLNFISTLMLNSGSVRGGSARTHELKIYDEEIKKVY